MARKLFKKKTLKEIKDGEFLIKRDYVWLPQALSGKKIKIRLIDDSDNKEIDLNKLNKTYKPKTRIKKVKIVRLYLGKEFIGKKIKLNIVK